MLLLLLLLDPVELAVADDVVVVETSVLTAEVKALVTALAVVSGEGPCPAVAIVIACHRVTPRVAMGMTSKCNWVLAILAMDAPGYVLR